MLVYMYISMYGIFLYVCIYERICVYKQVLFKCMCVHVNMHACMHVDMCIGIVFIVYICMYI